MNCVIQFIVITTISIWDIYVYIYIKNYEAVGTTLCVDNGNSYNQTIRVFSENNSFNEERNNEFYIRDGY